MMRLYLGYAPIWFLMLVIIVCDIYIVWAVYLSILQNLRMISTTTQSSSSDAPSSSSQPGPQLSRNEPSFASKLISRNVFLNRQVFIRFALGPFLMIILHIPGSILRLSQAAHIPMSSSQESFWSFAQAICDPMHGTINAAVWLLSDPKALNEWRDFFLRFFRIEEKDSFVSLPEANPMMNVAAHQRYHFSERSSQPLEYEERKVDEEVENRASSIVGPIRSVHSNPSAYSSSLSSYTRSRIKVLKGKWTWGVKSESSQERTNTSSVSGRGSELTAHNPVNTLIHADSTRPQFLTFESENEDRTSSTMMRESR